jgi:hypothetical protein
MGIRKLTRPLSIGELQFHENATPSLAQNVSHIVADPYIQLPKLVVPHGFSLVYSDERDLIDEACLTLIQSLPEDGAARVVGFHIEGETGLDVISISTSSTLFIFKV